MKRIHLFEFEDAPWFPSFLRNYGTDFLQFLATKTKMYQNIIPILEKGIEKSKTHQIIDLASGGGGGLIGLNPILRKRNPNLKIVLTDFYPNLNAFKHIKNQHPNINYCPNPVDARNVPLEFVGLRTQFLSFHHFKPTDAQKIIQNAIDSNNSIAIFEAQERSFSSILGMILSPISVLITTPFIKPFNFLRLFFTYIIPIVPLFVCWDGIISCFRTYSIQEMQDIIEKLDQKDRYEWEINRIKSGIGITLYLLATPKET